MPLFSYLHAAGVPGWKSSIVTKLAIGVGAATIIGHGYSYYSKRKRESTYSEGASETTIGGIRSGLSEAKDEICETIITPNMSLAYPNFYSTSEENRTLLAKCLKEELYEKLFRLKTKFGSTIDDCIQVGVDNPEGDPFDALNGDDRLTCGFVAADGDCYELFEQLFSPIVKLRHEKPAEIYGQIDNGSINFQWRCLSEITIRVHRNLSDVPFAPRVTRHQRRFIFNKMSEMCSTFDRDLEIYLLSNTNSKDDIDRLRRLNLYNDITINNFYRLTMGQYRDPMDARGVYLSGDQLSAVVINSLDHLIFVSRDTNGDFAEAYKRIRRMIDESEKWIKNDGCKFAYHDQFGYLTVLPEMLGAAATVSCTISVPPPRDSQLLYDVTESLIDAGLAVDVIDDPEESGWVHVEAKTVETFFEGDEGKHEIETVIQYMIQCLKKVRDTYFNI